MDRNELVLKVSQIIGEVIGVPESELAINSSVFNTNGWDSMATIQIFLNIEEYFGISISIDDGDCFQKVSDISELLMNKYLDEKMV